MVHLLFPPVKGVFLLNDPPPPPVSVLQGVCGGVAAVDGVGGQLVLQNETSYRVST